MNKDITDRFEALDSLLRDGYINDAEYTVQCDYLNQILLERAKREQSDIKEISHDYRDGLGGPHA